jgi:hypothetical protein
MMSDTEFLLLVDSKKKSGPVAALLNLFLPGAGYDYCGRWVLGIVAFFMVVAMFVVSLGFAAVGIILILLIDGFLCAGRYNKELVARMIEERHAADRQAVTP